MVDFRAELQALVTAYDEHGGNWLPGHEDALLAAVQRARAVLAAAQGEAGAGPSDEDWDALVQNVWDGQQTIGYQGERFMYEGDFEIAAAMLRDELARWGHPTPPAPVPELRERFEQILNAARCSPGRTVGNIELADRLIAALQQQPTADARPSAAPEPAAWMYKGEPDFDGKQWRENWEVTASHRLAAYKAAPEDPVPLYAQAHPTPPAPVPATERLPQPEDCDADERCWLLAPRWILPPDELTYWLPASALPLPTTEAPE